MDYRVYLDSTLLTDQPGGLQELGLRFEREPELAGVFYKYTSQLVFWGDGYDDLKAKYDANTCDEVNVLVQWRADPEGDYADLFEGVILTSKIDFNLTRKIATVRVTDDNLTARISGNWRIEGILKTDKSKNDVSITAATSNDLEFFNNTSGTYSFTGRTGYSVFEAMKWLVAFITDGEVDFASDTFGPGGDWEYLYVFTGENIRTSSTNRAPELSLYDLYREVNKKIPLGFWIEDNAGTPRLRVEERSYFYSASNALIHRNVGGRSGDEGGLVLKTDESLLYSQVKIGSKINTKNGGTFAFPDTRFFGWREETYPFKIGCNIDSELDLVNDYGIDSNTIEDIIGGSTEYDDELFLIVGEEYSLGSYRAIKYSDGISTFYYNQPLTNYNTAERWAKYIPGNFGKHLELTSVDNTFDADVGTKLSATTVTTSVTTIEADPFPFDSENSDTGGNYDETTNYRYTLPDDGQYRFEVEADYDIDALTVNADLDLTVKIRRYNSGGSLQETKSFTQTTAYGVSTFRFTYAVDIVGVSGDYVDVTIEGQASTGTIDVAMDTDTSFRCVSAPDTVVAFTTSETPRYKRYVYDFPIGKTDWDTIVATPNYTIIVNPSLDTDDDVQGWIFNMDYRPSEGIARIEIVV